MDFLNMDFGSLFQEKHGKQNFENISEQILQEKPVITNDNYIEIVFKTAFLDFFGLDNNTIEKMIEDIMKCEKVNVMLIKHNHKKSISLIQSYLQSAMKDTTK